MKSRKKRRRLTTLLAAVIMSVGMMAVPLAVHAYVVNVVAVFGFNLTLYSANNGYNSAPQFKNAGYPLFWVNYQTCSYGSGYPVNFLIIGAEDEQISHNVIINSVNQTGHAEYYASNHMGNVRLRANTGSPQDGYTITGVWGPNAYYYVTP